MTRKTQVAIIGAGPAGLTLSLLLKKEGIESVILESRSRSYVEARARAGLLEQNTVDLLDALEVSGRLHTEGQRHLGVILSFNGRRHRICFEELTPGRAITIYGQQEVIKDLIRACLERGVDIEFESTVLAMDPTDKERPVLTYEESGQHYQLACDFVAGCDGYHGISRSFLPPNSYTHLEKVYPFSWLGILAKAEPATSELIYAYHERGFALHSLRSREVSRLYLQVSNQEDLNQWSDKRIWDELQTRLSDNQDFRVNRGQIFEKAITPMRAFVINSMQHERLFVAGDAAHIVPPTGGKGLNLAVADVRILALALASWYRNGDNSLLSAYSNSCLRRVWRTQDFSNFMTYLFHQHAPHGSYDYQLQKARFDYLCQSKAQSEVVAENYVGLKAI